MIRRTDPEIPKCQLDSLKTFSERKTCSIRKKLYLCPQLNKVMQDYV